ncbi:MAG: class I tRNA ligase family protein [Coriobacteriales bacterium]|nr:class I tRNA ligase family protein [Coriobacteriales bacterium]
MPYGNKGLHFGHIGGVFVPADAYARFLRDRIGEENVLFVCGTDCYGSPIDEGYRRLVETEGFDGSITDYVQHNHDAQVATLHAYSISCDIFEGSGIGASAEIHAEMTDWIIRRLYERGYLHRIATAQFFDEEVGSFLNGRQVMGHCPVVGCKSEHAYADECDLGHQYLPVDLINPISALSGKRPVMREVANWYFDLPAFRALLQTYVDELAASGTVRDVVRSTIDEFLVDPIIYVKSEFEDAYHLLAPTLPSHTFREAEKGQHSFALVFSSLVDRDRARSTLDDRDIRYRTGKALVPFRITGNIIWGVPAPILENVEGLTVWCWPESLWAPISFTRAYLEARHRGIETLNPGRTMVEGQRWEDFWCDTETALYQFIGQDNIYFYGIAQTALWAALPEDHEPRTPAENGEIQQSLLVANHHLQFLGKKASSSGAIKPPMADELLDYYTPEQLRAHFLALGLGLKPVSFAPKALNPSAGEHDADPVLKEGQLLTNVFNRLARSCFYAAFRDNEGYLPLGVADEEVRRRATATILEYERLMHRQELHVVMHLMDDFIRFANRYWSDAIKEAGEDIAARRAVLRTAFYLLRVCTILMHPIAPLGTQMILDYLALDITAREFFSWEHIFESYEAFCAPHEVDSGKHRVRELPPRTDFFARHPSQYL